MTKLPTWMKWPANLQHAKPQDCEMPDENDGMRPLQSRAPRPEPVISPEVFLEILDAFCRLNECPSDDAMEQLAAAAGFASEEIS